MARAVVFVTDSSFRARLHALCQWLPSPLELASRAQAANPPEQPVTARNWVLALASKPERPPESAVRVEPVSRQARAAPRLEDVAALRAQPAPGRAQPKELEWRSVLLWP